MVTLYQVSPIILNDIRKPGQEGARAQYDKLVSIQSSAMSFRERGMKIQTMKGLLVGLLLVCLLLPLDAFAETAPDSQFLILLTNDDGYTAPG